MPAEIIESTATLVPVAPGLKKKHAQLAVLWLRHGTTITQFWRSLDHEQRVAAITSKNPDDPIITAWRDSSRTYRGELCRVLAPDWNLQDLSDKDHEHLLDQYAERAASTLLEQGRESDPAVVSLNFREDPGRSGTSTTKQMKLDGRFMVIKDGARYGEVTEVLDITPLDLLHSFDTRDGPIILPWCFGRHVLLRQEYLVKEMTALLQHLIDLEEWIRCNGPSTNGWAIEGRRESHVKFQLGPQLGKGSLEELMVVCKRHAEQAEAQLNILVKDPFALRIAALAHRHRSLEAPTRTFQDSNDTVGSCAVFLALVRQTAQVYHWNYITSLLQLYQSTNPHTTAARAVATEIHAISRQYMQKANHELLRRFADGMGEQILQLTRRMTAELHGAELQKENPHVWLVTRLLGAIDDSNEVSHWLSRIASIHVSEPCSDLELTYHENDTICVIARLSSFAQLLSKTIPQQHGQADRLALWFEAFHELRPESLPASQPGLDLYQHFRDVAESACRKHIHGGSVEVLARNESVMRAMVRIIEDDVLQPPTARALAQLENIVAASRSARAKRPLPRSLPPIASFSQFEHVTAAQGQKPSSHFEAPTPKTKHKTRPAQPIDMLDKELAEHAKDRPLLGVSSAEAAATSVVFKVKPQTSATFAVIFAKADARGSVSWAAFVSAMSDLGFAVIPKQGALTTFAPDSERMPGAQPFGIHRPHDGILEGFRLMKMARRLTRRYGWNAETFVEA